MMDRCIPGLGERMEQSWLQSNLADGARERVSRDLLDAATAARLAQMTGQVIEKALVEGGEAEGERHQVRVEY